MQYDLEEIEQHARQLAFGFTRPHVNQIGIQLCADAVLSFENLPDESDTLAGFHDTPWHYHGNLLLNLETPRYREFSPVELLSALRAADVLIIERFLHSQLSLRWLQHKLEPLNLRHIENGEEIRIRCCAHADAA